MRKGRNVWIALGSLALLFAALGLFLFGGIPGGGRGMETPSAAMAESVSPTPDTADAEETTNGTEETDMALSLLAINVGKADALLLRSGKTAYLIDTGTEDSFEQMYRVLKAEGVEALTGVILTHTDRDHIGGLEQLVESGMEIGTVYASAYHPKKSDKKHPAVKILNETDKDVQFIKGGDSLPMDGGTLEVLGPLEKSEDKDDNNSLVILATGGGGSMLLAGDMEFPEEESLLAAGAIPRADVLKVGNHGDDDATSDALIQAVRPKTAVISTSTAEKQSTPAKRVLRLLKSWNVQVLQTQDAEKGVLVTLRNGEILTELK